MSKRAQRETVRTFIAANYVGLAATLVQYRKSREWPHDCKFHDLASLCVPLAASGDEYNEAEHMLVTHLLENAARSPLTGAIRNRRSSNHILYAPRWSRLLRQQHASGPE